MSRAENRLLDLDQHISKLKRIEGAILDESDIPSRKRRKRPSVAFRPTLAMRSGIGGPPSTLTTGCAIPMLDKTNELETNDEPQPLSVANTVLPKPVQHRRFDQWLSARGEPLKEGGGKAFRASAILAFRNGPSPSCL